MAREGSRPPAIRYPQRRCDSATLNLSTGQQSPSGKWDAWRASKQSRVEHTMRIRLRPVSGFRFGLCQASIMAAFADASASTQIFLSMRILAISDDDPVLD
ncbi:hypothetical protein O6H91_15G046200 [Diphasiastrum complanatum]|uniref:Uncharacterized protein n=2 Tax=Diphasiastrum complanatum TaxID=34168 RepID=A0ACC2BHU4_DIPCM|nr:hypothetical protein O6H91_15G045900 [Diphasiastrum complanatum]KAJ7529362.1 hypothetical protein O6H91_15G046200 [Diphasiastrum complanatum]